jgi:copper resistance protein B
MSRLALALILAALPLGTAAAQDHDMASMPDMAMPGATAKPAAAAAPEPPEAPPPPIPADHYADRDYDPAAMAAARMVVENEHGGDTYHKTAVDLAEYQARDRGAYRWEGEYWSGGDINRFVVKTEGEGSRREGLEAAEVQALVSRAITPTLDLQVGVRQDFAPGPARTYAAAGIEGTTPYWFEIMGAVFVSPQGDVLARAEGMHDFRITQRLIVQPRVELNFAAQDSRATRTGAGLSQGEYGLRLRYEFSRQLAPYVGVSYERRYGHTADFTRAEGKSVAGAALVLGLTGWF